MFCGERITVGGYAMRDMNEVYITKINIKKVRHLKDIEIILSEAERKHLILTGENGSGKTSLLETIKQAINSPTMLRAYICSIESVLDIEFNANFNDVRNNLINRGLFVLGFWGAHRRANIDIPIGPRKINLQGKAIYHISSNPSKLLVQYLVNQQMKILHASKNNDIETENNLENWFRMLEKRFKFLFNDDTLELKFDIDNYTFNFITKNREIFGFDTLSDGYSAVIDIVSGIMLKMEDKSTNAYDLPGIVLIDEIETHLHVDLQKKILPFLTDFFPNIQFIVSTHSPFILNSMDNAVIYDLEHQIRVEDLSAYSYEAIVEKYFDVDKYSDEIKKLVREYEQLIIKKQRTEEEDFRLLELQKYFSKIPSDFAPELVAHFQKLELQEELEND